MNVCRAIDTYAFAIARVSAVFSARGADGFIVDSAQTIDKTSRLPAFIGYAGTIRVGDTSSSAFAAHSSHFHRATHSAQAAQAAHA